MSRSDPANSVISRRVVGSIKRQLAKSNGLIQLPAARDFTHQLIHGAPEASVICITIERMADGGIRMTVETGIAQRQDQCHTKAYALQAVTDQNAAATAKSIVGLLAPRIPTIRLLSPAVRRRASELQAMDIRECTEWIEILAGQSDMRSTLTFRRPSPQAAIQIGEN